MRAILAIAVLSPVFFLIFQTLWQEFRHEVVTGYNQVNVRVESKKVRTQIELEFPMVVELFAILLAGNLSPATALGHISERTTGEFSKVLKNAIEEMQQGASFSQTLDALSARVGSPMVRRFFDSLMIAVDRGSPLIDVVNRQVEEVRSEQRTRLLESAGKAEIALMIPIVFLILPLSVLFALWPSYFAFGRSVGF